MFEKTKVRIRNEEESRMVQEKMFELGYSWMGDKSVKYLSAKGLFFERNKCITFIYTDNGYFNNHKFVEVILIRLFCLPNPASNKELPIILISDLLLSSIPELLL